MIMYCPKCGEVIVNDEAYNLWESVRKLPNFDPLLHYHPLTCECGLFLMEEPSTPRPYDECESWPQCASCSHFEWYMHDCTLMLDITKPKRDEYVKWKGDRY